MKKTFLLILITTFILSGCGLTQVQQEGVARFARATEAIGEISASSFSQSREAVIKMNAMNVALQGEAKIKDLDESFDPDHIAARIKAATALKSYGVLLLALAENTQKAELKQASDEFVDSFKVISNKKLTDEQYDSLGKIVHTIGGFFVEYKKAKAIKNIVLKMEGDVELVCKLLEKDFDLYERSSAGGVHDAINRLRADTDIFLATEKDVKNRLIAVQAFQLASTNREKLDTLVVKIKNLISSLKDANSQLVSAIKEENLSISEIKAMGVKFKELSDAIRVFSG